MGRPTDDQLAALGAQFDAFTRRYKLADALGAGKALNELDKQVLLYVADHPGCGPSDAARYLGVANTTLSSAADRLAKRGLLIRQRPEGDRRAVALVLSEPGTSAVAAMRVAFRDLSRRMLEPLTPGERESLIAIMAKILSYED